ncbi:FliH/SctL family protein [Halothermothrix orenii]|uniref:Flagellar biosynthesis/type III secretory pathway protein n=1 Tax=Halothermothrix orenii (strain H 168 / OCM 544 / DSM 9562) TaxID=373903 RepID=B8CYR8_HALOH|nr:FliH/SctL family protein [Halothermothrix orenii]ACL70437.1 Flagellar biosynthesis/type III secretory pathway protein [Halothermothrix orenii H 168]
MSKVIKSSRIIGEYRIKDVRHGDKDKKNSRMAKSGEKNRETSAVEKELNSRKKEIMEKTIAEANQRKEDIISKAEEEAENILYDARQKAEELTEKGYEEGFNKGHEQGYEEGYETALNNLQSLISTIEKSVTETEAELNKEVDRLPGEIIKLAVRIAEKIVNTRIELEPGVINPIVKGMLDGITRAEEVYIKINPGMFEYLDEEDIKSGFNRQKIKILPDDSLKPGDCTVETELGGKDGLIETKLELVEKELLKGAGIHEGD